MRSFLKLGLPALVLLTLALAVAEIDARGSRQRVARRPNVIVIRSPSRRSTRAAHDNASLGGQT